jgi:hypothetical protein
MPELYQKFRLFQLNGNLLYRQSCRQHWSALRSGRTWCRRRLR